MIQPINSDYLYNATTDKVFNMIDNYIYLYHTKTLIAVPTYPEQIADSMTVTYNQATPLSRSAPIFSYANSGPRVFAVNLKLHRDMMNEVNVAASKLNVPDLQKEDYIDIMIRQLQAMALPRYAASEKMVDPPVIAVRFGNDIFCKGIINGNVNATYEMPILTNDKYAIVNVDFQIAEIDPYDADTVLRSGSFRGLNTDLERNVWKIGNSNEVNKVNKNITSVMN